jgi:hypothetical protein
MHEKESADIAYSNYFETLHITGPENNDAKRVL